MDFHDFPMILGNQGVETDHPPKMCAGLQRGVAGSGSAHAVVAPRGSLGRSTHQREQGPLLRGIARVACTSSDRTSSSFATATESYEFGKLR